MSGSGSFCRIGMKSTMFDMGPVQFLLIRSISYGTVAVSGWRNKHESSAESESCVHKFVVNTFSATAEGDGEHVVERASACVWLESVSIAILVRC